MLVLLLIIGLWCGLGSGELYSSLAMMEDLPDTEAVLFETLQSYITSTERKLELLKIKLIDYKTDNKPTTRSVHEYLNNPINVFLLIRRLTIDWKEIETLISRDDVGKEVLKKLFLHKYENAHKFPTDNDLNGAAVALVRLQDVYNLNVSSLAEGELNGIQYNTHLTSSDCFEIGRRAYLNQDFQYASMWLMEARNLCNGGMCETVKILEYLASSTFKQGDVDRALQLTNELLEVQPRHESALANKEFYENTLKTYKKKLEEKIVANKTGLRYSTTTEEFIVYRKLCRKEWKLSDKVKSELKCRYVNKGKPFLKIAPFKEEEVFLDPRIVVYHDVITNDEISTLKKLAIVEFKMQNMERANLKMDHYRISRTTGFKDEDDKHIATLSQRVEDMTGLTTSTTEMLHITNYGVGGQYEPHFDYLQGFVAPDTGLGDRIATVLFYMSHVEQGGLTVFPTLNVTLSPMMGSAAFWYNLHSNGQGDIRTKHAACPVLVGSKWVANKWIYERGQEFKRPCNLISESNKIELK